MSRVVIPRNIFFGDKAIEELKVLKGKRRAMIVMGSESFKTSGMFNELTNVLNENEILFDVISGIKNDPYFSVVKKGAEQMLEFQPDVIIAVGGGSPIDAAKAMWALYEHPELTFEDLKKIFSMPKLREKAVFVAIPTTSGTGTEVTAFSIITDDDTKVKHPIADYEIVPDIAVLDTRTVMSMPKELVAHTGLDALTHSLEAYVAVAKSDFSDAVALKSIVDMFEHLPKSYVGEDKSRAKMHIAQCLAGISFSNALLGIVHALAHNTGVEFDLPHGLCNAIMLPYAIQFNSKTSAKEYAEIARAIGIKGGNDKVLTMKLAEAIKELNKKVGIAQTYRENGITEKLFFDRLEKIAVNAKNDPCSGCNPREVSVDQLKQILIATYYGMDISF